ncbi:MAG TPA: ABC transporter permease [Thermoanaerobaculia bacterium]|nr:ABC transporter permease [Thermoanaerobaculia bacterium]
MRRYLFLLRELVKRDFQGRYAGSLLGFVWSMVQPLWLLVLFTFVFSEVMKATPLGVRTDDFAIFLFCGLLPWLAVQEGVLRASTAITDNASLVKKLRFPSEILVLAVVLAALLHEAIAALMFLGVLLWVGDLSPGGLPLLLLAVPLQVALTLGLGLLLSPVHVFFRDTAQVLSMVLTAWFYLTPIVYPLPLVPEKFRPWLELNPLTPLVGLYRQAFVGGESVPGVGFLAAAAAVLLSAGFWLFARLKPAFADEI